MTEPGAGDTDPSLPPREELILLALFAIDPDAPHQLRELTSTAELVAMEPKEVADCLHELHRQGLVVFDSGTEEGIHLTPQARALVLQLAEERLTDNILRQRSLQEQAESLVIWRLGHL